MTMADETVSPVDREIAHASYRELKALRGKIDDAIRQRRAEALAELEVRRQELVAELGLDEHELDQRGCPEQVLVRVRYRDPETGAHWSGRGKRPAWLKAKLDAGHPLSDFEVGRCRSDDPPPCRAG